MLIYPPPLAAALASPRQGSDSRPKRIARNNRYDNLGQVISGKRSWQDGTPVAGQQFAYTFDDIGNRTATAVGGDQHGANLRSATYGANHLNQYTNRTIPGAVDITGIANPTAAVTVNGSNAVRQGEYFWQPVTVGNTNAAQYVTNIVASTYGSGQSATGAVFIARTPEAFSYDADGNLTSDGRWTYTWDGENRLASMTANTSAGPQQQLVFQYDWQGRRIAKQVSVNVGGGWSPISDQRFVYDGWNLLAVLDGSLLLQTSFVWGLDLSGSMQGAGGVGGLLFLDNCESPIGSHAATYDGNGNVAALVSAADCSVSARYEYGPFGEILRSTGPARETNPFRFSTKYQDDETDLLYYGYRYYNATTGRWLSRDPMAEEGGENLYALVCNDPTLRRDYLGLKVIIRSIIDVNPQGAEAEFANPDGFGTREEFLNNYNALKKTLENAIEKLRNCCKSHNKELGEVPICKFLDDSESHFITGQ